MSLVGGFPETMTDLASSHRKRGHCFRCLVDLKIEVWQDLSTLAIYKLPLPFGLRDGILLAQSTIVDPKALLFYSTKDLTFNKTHSVGSYIFL